MEDDDFSVWSTISTLFIRFIRVFEHVGKHESFKSYGRYIYGQVYRRVGWIDLEEEREFIIINDSIICITNVQNC